MRARPAWMPQFGRGILNIERAFQPQGALTMAGSKTPVPDSANGKRVRHDGRRPHPGVANGRSDHSRRLFARLTPPIC